GIGERAESVTLVAQNVGQYWWAIYLYVIVTTGLGALLGWGVGHKIVSGGRLSVLARHSWVYQLTPRKATAYPWAFVMTRVQQDDRVLLYRGFLTAFGLAADGCISYVVLSEASRLYMYLEKQAARTSRMSEYRRIGASRSAGVAKAGIEKAILVIHGHDIANVVVEPYELTDQPASMAALREMIDRIGQSRIVKVPLDPRHS
ncbi:MAG TPA: hypothetical protein VNX67_01330, partial [Solirubrobacteraceae bacterium]|nr:hypothetical protein [Solirubrobacteraceae bacterium]